MPYYSSSCGWSSQEVVLQTVPTCFAFLAAIELVAGRRLLLCLLGRTHAVQGLGL